jgi:hypothetical protein
VVVRIGLEEAVSGGLMIMIHVMETLSFTIMIGCSEITWVYDHD